MKLLSLFSFALAYPGDDRASCEQNIIANRIYTCESQNYSLSYCARYINDEMVRNCRGSYSCTVTTGYDYSAYYTYAAYGNRYYAICGRRDGNYAVNRTTLENSCQAALNHCPDSDCIREGSSISTTMSHRL